MSEITGYIEVPFHGEKGESAYDIAVKYGYKGTEEEWVDSLGFIPDKSIGEAKLSDAMVGKLRAYEGIIDSLFEKKNGYKECVVNEYDGVAGTQTGVTTDEWINALQNYKASYLIKGVYNKNIVLLPKLNTNVNVFDETNALMWSVPSGMYHVAKIDVAPYVGKSVKIYGRSQATAYPLAFCVDNDGNILEKYGTDTYTWYGYSVNDGNNLSVTTTDPFEAIVPDGAKYMYIQGGCSTSGGVVIIDAIPMLEFADETYEAKEAYDLMRSPLWGKKLYVDGDSICYGNGYTGGYGKIIADKYKMTLVNAGVGGATICMGALKNVPYGTNLDWNNNEYYLNLTHFDPFTNKNIQTFAYPITCEQYESGFGKYPTAYKLVNGELTEQEYSEAMPSGTFFVKFNVSTYDDNTVDMFYRMWADNSWLWEAYNSGFTKVHEAGTCRIGTAAHWLCQSVEKVDSTADYIIFEGGINDYLGARQLGEITPDMTGVVDTTTVIGGMEYICRQLLTKCVGKKILYVITPKANGYAHATQSSMVLKTWTDYHDAILAVLRKYSISVVDLFNNSAFNTEIESYLQYTRNGDGVHPTKEGYELFFVPQIVSLMESI